MTSALKKLEASASVKQKSKTATSTPHVVPAKSKEAATINTAKNSVFNRFLEASCDCV